MNPNPIIAAREFMKDKGYPDTDPISCQEIEGESVWYVTFAIPEGEVEIEVAHDGVSWHWVVSDLRSGEC